MDKQEMINRFLDTVPELRAPYFKAYQEMRLEPEDGIYALWIFGIMSCVKKLLDNPEANYSLLTRIFSFFEKMAAAEDQEEQDLLMCGTLETLDDTPEILSTSQKFMGPRTAALWRRVDDFWNLRLRTDATGE